ncbi:MAG: Cof-type HAD-IIB family hydrolase [Eubacterium sp.]|nr:Cof-type HAD-IIB family hydrolase [Eubacterium sp.]
MSDKKLLVLDIDGTLTNSKKEITDATKEAIKKIQQDGHIVVIASGRPTPGTAKVADELELDKTGGYVLSYNGARITDWKTKEIIYQNTLDQNVISDLYEYATENDLGLVTYQEQNVVTGTRHDDYMEMEARINGIPIVDVKNFPDYVDFDVNKCLLTAPVDSAPEHETSISELLDNANVCRSEPFFIEVMPQGVDKAASLDKLVQILDMKQENTICCGDGFNDLSMIQYAGVGVAMENAQDEVKNQADFITKSNDDDGIVHVIDTFFK